MYRNLSIRVYGDGDLKGNVSTWQKTVIRRTPHSKITPLVNIVDFYGRTEENRSARRKST